MLGVNTEHGHGLMVLLIPGKKSITCALTALQSGMCFKLLVSDGFAMVGRARRTLCDLRGNGRHHSLGYQYATGRSGSSFVDLN